MVLGLVRCAWVLVDPLPTLPVGPPWLRGRGVGPTARLPDLRPALPLSVSLRGLEGCGRRPVAVRRRRAQPGRVVVVVTRPSPLRPCGECPCRHSAHAAGARAGRARRDEVRVDGRSGGVRPVGSAPVRPLRPDPVGGLAGPLPLRSGLGAGAGCAIPYEDFAAASGADMIPEVRAKATGAAARPTPAPTSPPTRPKGRRRSMRSVIGRTRAPPSGSTPARSPLRQGGIHPCGRGPSEQPRRQSRAAVRWPDGEPLGPIDQSVPASACRQPGGLVRVGRGGLRAGELARRADPALRRLRRLPLVPRHGPRVLRGPRPSPT